MTKVEVGYFSDKRLMLLLTGRLSDTNVRIDLEENRYSICLEEDTINLIPELYTLINSYNKLKTNRIRKFDGYTNRS